MGARLLNAWGYQGDAMNLPVEDLAAAIPFYERAMCFQVESRADAPDRSAVIARDGVRMGLAENGGDSTQDGCAFQTDDVEGLLAEFRANGMEKELSALKTENRPDGSTWKAFFVVAPDGLCYWFGERQ